MRNVFGWSRPFRSDSVPSRLLAWLEEADALETVSGLLRSKVRYSTLKGSLYVHSAFPTVEADAVFFGPDTYRFADFIERSLVRRMGGQVGRILDIGCGSGAGGLFLAGLPPSREVRVLLSDINSKALRYARVNAALGDKKGGEGNATLLLGDTARFLKSAVDIIVSNPPYLVDAESRMYRDGGGASGCELSLRIVRESLPLLAPGGMLILYTGTPVMEGTFSGRPWNRSWPLREPDSIMRKSIRTFSGKSLPIRPTLPRSVSRRCPWCCDAEGGAPAARFPAFHPAAA